MILRNSNTTRIERLKRSINHGYRQLTAVYSQSKSFADTKTYYLLKKTGEILCYREWYQMNKPEYVATGSLSDCQKQKACLSFSL